jgi:hypothetical protein
VTSGFQADFIFLSPVQINWRRLIWGRGVLPTSHPT